MEKFRIIATMVTFFLLIILAGIGCLVDIPVAPLALGVPAFVFMVALIDQLWKIK